MAGEGTGSARGTRPTGSAVELEWRCAGCRAWHRGAQRCTDVAPPRDARPDAWRADRPWAELPLVLLCLVVEALFGFPWHTLVP